MSWWEILGQIIILAILVGLFFLFGVNWNRGAVVFYWPSVPLLFAAGFVLPFPYFAYALGILTGIVAYRATKSWVVGSVVAIVMTVIFTVVALGGVIPDYYAWFTPPFAGFFASIGKWTSMVYIILLTVVALIVAAFAGWGVSKLPNGDMIGSALMALFVFAIILVLGISQLPTGQGQSQAPTQIVTITPSPVGTHDENRDPTVIPRTPTPTPRSTKTGTMTPTRTPTPTAACMAREIPELEKVPVYDEPMKLISHTYWLIAYIKSQQGGQPLPERRIFVEKDQETLLLGAGGKVYGWTCRDEAVFARDHNNPGIPLIDVLGYQKYLDPPRR